jgi:hypothetical protein
MLFYYAGVLASGVYCASQMLFALFSLLLNLALQSVDFCFCCVGFHKLLFAVKNLITNEGGGLITNEGGGLITNEGGGLIRMKVVVLFE